MHKLEPKEPDRELSLSTLAENFIRWNLCREFQLQVYPEKQLYSKIYWQPGSDIWMARELLTNLCKCRSVCISIEPIFMNFWSIAAIGPFFIVIFLINLGI